MPETTTQTTNRTLCGAKSRQTGDPCRHQAGFGTDHLGYGLCKLHGGSVKAHRKRAAGLEAADIIVRMGLPTETEPHEALLEALYTAKGLADYAGHMLALLSTEHELAQTVPGDDVRFWHRVRTEAVASMAHFSKLALDAGVQERQTLMVERMGGALADLLRGVLDELALSPEQKARAPMVIQRHLELASARIV